MSAQLVDEGIEALPGADGSDLGGEVERTACDCGRLFDLTGVQI